MFKHRPIICILLMLCLLAGSVCALDESEPEAEWVSVGAIVGEYYYELDLGVTIVMKGEESGTFTLSYPGVSSEGTWYTLEKGKLVFEIDGSHVDAILTPETGYLVLSLDGHTLIAFLPLEKTLGTQPA